MILANLKEATNINEYQTSLKQQLQKAHGEQYTDYLDEIYRLTKNAQSYREIGTYQGASNLLGGSRNPPPPMPPPPPPAPAPAPPEVNGNGNGSEYYGIGSPPGSPEVMVPHKIQN